MVFVRLVQLATDDPAGTRARTRGVQGQGGHPQNPLMRYKMNVYQEILYGTTIYSLAKSCPCRKGPLPVRSLRPLSDFVPLQHSAESDAVPAGPKS